MAAIQQLATEAPPGPRWRKILAVERTVDEDQAFVLALVENLHREDLAPQDEAAALEALEQQLGSLQGVADAIKRSKAYVSRRIRTYQDPILAAAILDRGLAPTTAQEFLPVKDAELRRMLVPEAVRKRWDAPLARAAVRDRCDSQQVSAGAGEAAGRCESQQMDTAAEAARERSRAIVRQVHALRHSLQAGPLDTLSDAAVGELQDLAQEITNHLPGLRRAGQSTGRTVS